MRLGVVSTDDIPGLYRAARRQDWDEHGTIHPRCWVESSIAWPHVSAGIENPSSLVELALQRGNFPPPVSLEKLIAEAVFERVREQVVPSAPSRLRCVFAALDAYAAADFAAATSPPLTIDPRTGDFVDPPMAKRVTTNGRPWIATDMRLFSMHPETATDVVGILSQIVMLERQARDYWQGRVGPDPRIEVLVEAVDLLAFEAQEPPVSP